MLEPEDMASSGVGSRRGASRGVRSWVMEQLKRAVSRRE